jgi:hypothetical protein
MREIMFGKQNIKRKEKNKNVVQLGWVCSLIRLKLWVWKSTISEGGENREVALLKPHKTEPFGLDQ